MNPHARKKVLLLITKAHWGGAQRYVFDVATNLPRAEYEVSVAVGGEGELTARLREAGVRVHTLPSLCRDISLLREWRAFRNIISLIKREAPDVLHLNSSKAGGLGGLAGRLLGVPHIVFTAHGWAFNEERRAWERALIYPFVWLTLLFSHRTICVSHATLRDVTALPLVRHKCTVVHNGITAFPLLSRTEARAALAARAALPPQARSEDAVWLGTVAELHPSKGHRYLLEALARLERPVRLFLMGAGELEEDLRRQAAALGIHTRVHFLGHVADARRYLKALDVFVLPSLTEALGIAVLEAGYATVPVVASRVGGIPEVLTDGTSGILVPPRDSAALADALRTLLDAPDLRARYANALHETVRTRFSWNATLEGTLRAYQG